MNIDDDPGAGLNDALARTIDGERVANRMTQDDLAAKAGIPSRTLQRYLSSERHMSIAVVERLARALDKKPTALLRVAELRLSAEDA